MCRCGLAVLLWMGFGIAMSATPLHGDPTTMAEIDAILQHDPHNYQARLLQARLFSQQGQSDAAIQAYRQLIQQQPSQPEALNNLAGILARQGDLSGAQQLLEQALNTNPTYATVYQNLSAIYVEQARTSYGKALRLEQNTSALTLTELDHLTSSQSAVPSSATTLAAVTAATTPAPVTPAVSAGVKPEVSASVTASVAVVPPPPSVATATKVSVPPVKAPAKAKPELDQQQLITTLEGWAAAWSGKAPELYFSFYDKGFSPPGTARADWETQRRERLTEPQWIKVGLSEFTIKPLQAQRARVRFIQEYQSEGYRDRIRKEIVMQYTIDGWRIIAERKIAALR